MKTRGRFLLAALCAGLLPSLAAPVAARAQQHGPVTAPRTPPATATAQTVSNPTATPAEAAALSLVKPVPDTLAPTWETQPDARTVYFEIPAPRGQITDRNGLPLAQSRLGYHLDLAFPNGGPELSDTQVAGYVRQHLIAAQALLRRPLELTTAEVLDHYKNRRVLPMDIATYLTPEEVERLRPQIQPPLSLRPVYLRFYPNGSSAAHIIGYVGKTGGNPHGPLQPNEPLWPNLEGREGLELSFNEQLTGKNGSLNLTFDGQGNKTSERVLAPPTPGKTVVTTLDLPLQKMCEDLLAKGKRPGSMVFIDPNNGDVLAMASYPSFDPNAFVPAISKADFDRLNNDREHPLIPRAYRASYPAGSTFKIHVGAAALASGTISKNDQFPGPAAMQIGNVVMHNWKKHDVGDLNFVEALTQSCDTWFYQVGMKTGADRIVDWGQRFGFGRKTGLPLRDEDKGVMPDNNYMKKFHKRRLLDGDVANLSIGQGDLLVTPIQMAQSMATVANGGIFYQLRLVKQTQAVDGEVQSGYPVQPRSNVGLGPDIWDTLRKGMVGVIEDRSGTAHQAHVPNVEVAGKTGTAQWGAGNQNKEKSRTAAWFVGFAPAEQPKYAFAVCIEGAAGDTSVHGGTAAAPLIGKALREIYKDAKPTKKSSKRKAQDDDDEADDDDQPRRHGKPAQAEEADDDESD